MIPCKFLQEFLQVPASSLQHTRFYANVVVTVEICTVIQIARETTNDNGRVIFMHLSLFVISSIANMSTIDLSHDNSGSDTSSDASDGAFNHEAHPAYSILDSRRAPFLKTLPDKRSLLVSLGAALRYETYFSNATKETHDPGLQDFLASVRGMAQRESTAVPARTRRNNRRTWLQSSTDLSLNVWGKPG